MFIAALFIIAPYWKQPKCSLTEEFINKLWNIYTVEYSTAIKKKWTTDISCLGESQRHVEQKKHWSFTIDKMNQDGLEKISGKHPCRGRWWIIIRKGYKETCWSAKKVLYVDLGTGYMGIYVC